MSSYKKEAGGVFDDGRIDWSHCTLKMQEATSQDIQALEFKKAETRQDKKAHRFSFIEKL